MIKPDGVQRGLVGEIIKRFEAKGYKLVAMKLTAPGKEHMEKHYADLSSKGFFAGLVEYMTSGPVVAMVWEGANVVSEGRKMLGATKPSESACGTIRGDYCIEGASTKWTARDRNMTVLSLVSCRIPSLHTPLVGRNVCHGSDSVESANAEIALWFPEGITEWASCTNPWVYE
jgi:nucleoside-diphosphate kinase